MKIIIVTILLLYIQGLKNRISRIVKKYDIKTVFNTSTKIKTIFRSPKDKIPEMQIPGVYEIPCSCEKSYIEQTESVIAIRIK